MKVKNIYIYKKKMGKVNSFLLCKQEEDIEVVEERAYVNWAMVQKCIVLVLVVVLVIVLVLCCVSCKDTQN